MPAQWAWASLRKVKDQVVMEESQQESSYIDSRYYILVVS